MSLKAMSFGGALLLAGALALTTPDSAQTQHRGGGHGGGFHSGGFHSGGFHGGSFHSGGFHSGSFYGGFHHTYPHHGYWGNHHYHYRPYYGWYGGYPYYGLYGSYYDTYPYAGSTPAYDSSYYDYYGGQTPSYSDRSHARTPPPVKYQPDNTAHITVSVPPGAEICLDDYRSTATGSVREFNSPPLTPGGQYAYEIRARWNENGQEVTQTQRVPVAAGAHVRVVFPVGPTKAITAPNR